MARIFAGAAVKGERLAPMETASENLKRVGAAFVTLKNRGRLRGCIGTIFAQEPLYLCVQRRAVDAAINDSRFFMDRITPAELAQIEIEISVLTPPVPARPEEIVVGRDGVLLSVGPYHGVFLPQVPVEQGWDRETYLNNLCHKAGSRDPNCWRKPEARLERFEAIVFSEHELGL
jgi:AmmeMemoRadiSam system protein A